MVVLVVLGSRGGGFGGCTGTGWVGLREEFRSS